MNTKPLVIFGASGHAKVILDIAEKQGHWNILGLLDSYRPKGFELLGYAVLGGNEALADLLVAHPELQVFIAIGDNHNRERIATELQATYPSIQFATLIHPGAHIAKVVSIGEGTVVMPGAVINNDSRIGKFVIVNTNVCVEHDGKLEDFSSLAPGVTLGGNCHIGRSSAISIGATIKHGIQIGEHTVIGAGSVVLENIEAFSIAYGIPAKKVRSREKGERYL
jgi:sugar O-acyltransferase (sialic acid O-acetyltransferase NeuD family)